jgi:mutator protein MutT
MLPLHVVGAAITQHERCLVAQRGPTMSLPGNWEFPGGKVEPTESPTAALAREVTEELGLQIAVGHHLGTGSAHVGTRIITLDVYAATITAGTLTPPRARPSHLGQRRRPERARLGRSGHSDRFACPSLASRIKLERTQTRRARLVVSKQG